MIDILKTGQGQMTLGERAALEGLLSQVRPRLAIEIGTAEGGSLRRVAKHSEWVHSFDLVHPTAAADLHNVTLHVGDSHLLLPTVLAELARERRKVDFVLVDGDHTVDGVERDVRDLLSSDAIRRTLILVHDTMNDDVRAGLNRIDYAADPKVVHAELDLVAGHLSFGGSFHHELWGGLGLILVDDRAEPAGGDAEHSDTFYELYELIAPVRDALVVSEQAGGATGPGSARAALRNRHAQSAEIAGLRDELARTRAWLDSMQRSMSWRLTVPLRRIKRGVLSRKSGP
jgi:hypothetical protein